MAFLIGPNLNYLVSCLNSKPIDFYIKSYVHRYSDVGFLLSNQYVERILIPKISIEHQKPFVEIVDKILRAKAENQNADTTDLERQIDEFVYKLYELTQDEIEIIQEG